MRTGVRGGGIQRLRERLVEDVVDERRFARAADAGDGGQHAERDRDVDVLQVVRARAEDLELALEGRTARFRRRDRSRAGQIRAGEGDEGVGTGEGVGSRFAEMFQNGSRPPLHQLLGRTLEDDVAAEIAGARPEIDHVVGDADCLFVVLDDDHRVAEIAQPRERREQLAVVALMEADRRLVEHVEHAREVRADLRRQANALPFAAGERRGAPPERQVADADVVEEAQPLLNLAQDPLRDDRLAIREHEAVEYVEGLGNRQVDIVGDRALLHPDGEALQLQPLAPARRTRAQRTVLLQLRLLGPAAFVVPAPQVRQQPFESFAGAEEQHLARFARQPRERHVEIDAEVARQRLQRVAHQLAIAFRPRRDRAVGQRLRLVGDHALRIEVDHRSEALTVAAGAVRRVEREGARRHLRHAEPAVYAREPPREEAVAAFVRVDDDDVVGEREGGVDRLHQTALDSAAHDQPIDDDIDRVIAPPIELDVLLERSELAVDARLRVAALPQRSELLLELALAAADDRRQHVDPFVLRIEHHHVGDALERLARDLLAAARAVRHADICEQQTQVVVDLGDRADRGSGVRSGRLLLDRDRRGQTLDEIDVRLLHLLEELPGVGRQRLDVAALALGVDRIERERRLAGARQAGDHHQPVPRDVDVDVFQVVDACSAYRNPVVRHIRELEARTAPSQSADQPS